MVRKLTGANLDDSDFYSEYCGQYMQLTLNRARVWVACSATAGDGSPLGGIACRSPDAQMGNMTRNTTAASVSFNLHLHMLETLWTSILALQKFRSTKSPSPREHTRRSGARGCDASLRLRSKATLFMGEDTAHRCSVTRCQRAFIFIILTAFRYFRRYPFKVKR